MNTKWLVAGKVSFMALLVAGATYFKISTEHLIDQGYRGIPVHASIIMMSLLICWAVFMAGALRADLAKIFFHSAWEKKNHVKS